MSTAPTDPVKLEGKLKIALAQLRSIRAQIREVDAAVEALEKQLELPPPKPHVPYNAEQGGPGNPPPRVIGGSRAPLSPTRRR
jgi:hypothetical protein